MNQKEKRLAAFLAARKKIQELIKKGKTAEARGLSLALYKQSPGLAMEKAVSGLMKKIKGGKLKKGKFRIVNAPKQRRGRRP
ncbi:MAG TPA: hypothetical protein VI977_02090 [archaeon]|nr:hypothetical protein [archaeon]